MYSIEKIAELFQGEAHIGTPGASIDYLLIDSRKIVFPATSLFFAIKTSHRDGHRFITDVYERGVRNFIVQKRVDTAKFPGANFIQVPDTLHALQSLTAWHRAQFQYPVIGITGSNGKTIVKEWLYQLLLPEKKIIRSPRSYNSQVGVPLSVWQMKEGYELAIFEAGISEPDEMKNLATIIHPTIGILTNIGQAHQAGFKDLHHKTVEKLELFTYCNVVFCSADSSIIKEALPADRSYRLFTWGFDPAADLKIITINKLANNTNIEVSYQQLSFTVTIPFTDDASIQNAITCLAVLIYFKIPVNDISRRMSRLQPVDMRLQLVPGVNGCSVINDSYSFDINSFHIALDFLLQQQQYLKKTVIVSDLAASSGASTYQEVMELLQAKNIARIITIGENWMELYKELNGKMRINEAYKSTEAFIHQFSANHFKNEAILLKGARIFSFEKIAALLQKNVHQTVMEINLTAMAHNLKQYQYLLKPGTRLMAMVKAFGYGSGSAELASFLQFHKVDYLAVAYTDEGVDLRQAGIQLPILVLNVDEAAFDALVEYNLEPELFSYELLHAFISFLEKQGLQQYPIHIKLDTGMHRLGFEEKDLPGLSSLLKNNSTIVIRSVLSHLAASEDRHEDEFTTTQVKRFEAACDLLQKITGYSFLRHLSNSAAILRHPHLQYDMVRLGIGLYGINSSSDSQLALRPVSTLKTTIAQLRQVKAGETVGYNRRGKLNRDSLIATIRIGYADGFNRRMGNGVGKVFIKGEMAPVTGTVCMDMTMVDVTDIKGLKEGDPVEIFGVNLPVTQVAQWCDTIPYEILTGIHQRVKRIYLEE